MPTTGGGAIDTGTLANTPFNLIGLANSFNSWVQSIPVGYANSLPVGNAGVVSYGPTTEDVNNVFDQMELGNVVT